MKKAAVILGVLSLAAGAAFAQTSAQPAQPAQGTARRRAATAAAKRPPQAKTQPEFDAWKAASSRHRSGRDGESCRRFCHQIPRQ